jgi:tetraacyldisaccharide 4'-kinase
MRLVNANGATAGFVEFQGKPVAAFCGIGNPQGFRQTLADGGLTMQDSRFRTFADHHDYSEADLTSLGEWAGKEKVAAVLTTQKDLVKIPRTDLDGVPLWAVEIGIQWQAGEDLLLDRLRKLLEPQKA